MQQEEVFALGAAAAKTSVSAQPQPKSHASASYGSSFGMHCYTFGTHLIHLVCIGILGSIGTLWDVCQVHQMCANALQLFLMIKCTKCVCVCVCVRYAKLPMQPGIPNVCQVTDSECISTNTLEVYTMTIYLKLSCIQCC